MNPVKLVALILLVSVMVDAGIHASPRLVLGTLRNLRLMGRACLANFVLVPLAAFAVVNALHLRPLIALGIMLMAMAPGVPFLARSAGASSGGSQGLAIDLSVLMPALSVFTLPFTAELLLPRAGIPELPLAKMIVKIALFQLVPLAVGMIVVATSPKLAQVLKRPLAFLLLASILVLMVLIGPRLVSAVVEVQGSRGIAAMVLIVLVSLAVGWLLGGEAVEHRRTLAIATELRNIGLCLAIAADSFARTIVPATVMTYFLVQVVVSLVFGIRFRRTARRVHLPAPA